MSTPTANDLLMGGGVKSATFPTIGTTVTGTIARDPEVRQQIDLNSGEPKTFANGDPMLQIVVQLQTADRDPADTDDDGIRALYIKAQMMTAVRAAVRAAGAKGLEVGGVLSVTYSGDGETTKRGFNPPKQYAAAYRAPASPANQALMGNGHAAAAPAPVVEAPPPGVDAAMWSQLAPEQRAAVRASLSVAATANTPY